MFLLFEEQQAKCMCLLQERQGITILRLHNAPEGFANHIMQMTPLFNIINSYNVISLFVFLI
jgi:hypothetical protein